MRIPSWSQTFFALTMVGIGVLGFIKRDFTPTWSGVPNGFPGLHALAYLCAVISLVCGLGLLWQRTALVASRLLLYSFLVWLVLFRVSHFFSTPTAVDTWWGFADTAAMIAAAWVLYASFAARGERALRIARSLYGVALILFGLAHFTNLKDTVPLIPAWLPWHVFLAYFTGAAFMAAGVAALTGVFARLATTLATWQIALFTLIVWVPTVVAGPSPSQWSEFVSSVVLTATAWVVADSYHGTPWFALGKLGVPLTTTQPAT